MARILIVEDSDSVRCILASLLQFEGHEVDQAADGWQALVHFAAHPSDLVLMDLHMPRMNGLEACRRLRQESRVPILMLSTIGDPIIREQVLSCGANAFLSKPMEFEGLLSWIRRSSLDEHGN